MLCEQGDKMDHFLNLSLPVRSPLASNELYHEGLNFC